MMNILRTKKYRFIHWLFRWTVDSEGAITLTFANALNFTKYKEHTIIKLGRNWRDAPKHVETGMPRLKSYKPSDDPLEYHESFG